MLSPVVEGGFMKHRKLMTLTLLLILPVVIAAAENLQKVFQVDDDVYQLVEAILLEQGLAPPFSSKPWSADELKRILAQIPRETLSEAGRSSHDYLQRRLEHRTLYSADESAAFNTGINATFETYLHTNAENTRWEYGYEERSPLMTVPFELWLFDALYADLELTIREAHKTVGNPNIPPNWSNIPDTLYYLDSYFPFRAFISFGGPHWRVQFGRDSAGWGNGKTGNLLLSDYSDFYDLLQIATYWNTFKISATYAVFEAWWDDAQTYKAWYGHRLSMRLFKRLNISISESVIMGSQYPELIRDLNPLMIFHNWTTPERFNSMATVEIDLNPWKYGSIYVQYAIDDASTPYEADRADAKPGASGFIGGVQASIPVGGGYLSVNGEFAYTTPWMYLHRYTEHRYTNTRRIWSHVADSFNYVEKSVGYWAGPDTMLQHYEISYAVPGLLTSLFSVEYRLSGEIRFGSEYLEGEESFITTPSGEFPERELVLRLGVDVDITRWLSAGTDLFWLDRKNTDNVSGADQQDLQWALRLGVHF